MSYCNYSHIQSQMLHACQNIWLFSNITVVVHKSIFETSNPYFIVNLKYFFFENTQFLSYIFETSNFKINRKLVNYYDSECRNQLLLVLIWGNTLNIFIVHNGSKLNMISVTNLIPVYKCSKNCYLIPRCNCIAQNA